MRVAEVIVPLPLERLFHYTLSDEDLETVRPGVRVLVQFGPRKEYAAMVTRVLETTGDTDGLKPILQVLDERPVITEAQLVLWSWMASYYLCRRRKSTV